MGGKNRQHPNLKPQRKGAKIAKAAKENETDRRVSGNVESACLIAC
jgi:hypothetical protein